MFSQYFLNYKRFDERDHVSGVTQLKSSVQKGIRTKLLDQFPHLEDYMNHILPKKENLRVVKWQVYCFFCNVVEFLIIF